MTESSAKNSGLVIASYGRRGILANQDGIEHRYILKGRKLRVVCGDHVTWQSVDGSAEVLVTKILDRRNVLERPDSRGKHELIAANLSQIVVVLAPVPVPDFFLADRYLCAAAIQGADAIINWNKIDLNDRLPEEINQELLEYQALGYSVCSTSTKSGTGMELLESHLAKGVSMLVGQSGVGKSALINRLIEDADVRVGALSAANHEGRHTTTASFMYTLPNGGKLIDSPGVREFAPVIRDPRKIQNGFTEILQLADSCRFTDCQHLREPDCAVKQGCDSGKISVRRYESYKRLCNTTAALK
jgi:ribosome biogenesis GTPase